jgi:hypothetical protein
MTMPTDSKIRWGLFNKRGELLWWGGQPEIYKTKREAIEVYGDEDDASTVRKIKIREVK